MNMDDIRRITIVGAGLMGHGIGQEFAVAGYEVTLHDLSDEILEKALQDIGRNLKMLVDFGLVSEEQLRTASEAVHLNANLGEAVATSDMVIEAISEDLNVKRQVFATLDKACPANTILASNSSSFLPSQMASATGRPDKVLVTHYFNPPYLLPLVEIVRSPITSDETVSTVYELMLGIGKRPAIVQKEVPGFIGNRLQMALIRECLSIVEKGIASAEDVDTVVKNGFGRRLAVAGPIEVFDIGGWDIIHGLRQLFDDIESSPGLSQLVTDMVERGDLGVKTGSGFYDWTSESTEEARRRIAKGLVTIEQLGHHR